MVGLKPKRAAQQFFLVFFGAKKTHPSRPPKFDPVLERGV
jgi:hypothetical protein